MYGFPIISSVALPPSYRNLKGARQLSPELSLIGYRRFDSHNRTLGYFASIPDSPSDKVNYSPFTRVEIQHLPHYNVIYCCSLTSDNHGTEQGYSKL